MTADDQHVATTLGLIRRESDAICATLASLPAEAWQRTTNCPPWTVQVLAAHLVASVPYYLGAVEAGLRGEVGQQPTAEERRQRIERFAALSPDQILADLRSESDRFERTIGAVHGPRLLVTGLHSHGPRTVRWFADQRLAEVAFHRWDLLRSLDLSATLDEHAARHLLPMLIGQNLAAVQRGDWPRGSGRFRLAARDESALSWLMEAAPGALTVSEGSGGAADVEIAGSAAGLALLVYGRQSFADLEAAGALSASGDRGLAVRFNEIIKGP